MSHVLRAFARPAFLASACALLALLPSTSHAVAYSAIGGYFQSTAPGNGLTLVSPALARPSVYQGVLASAAGATLTFTGNPAWTANRFAPVGGNTFYVRLLTGVHAGQFLTITASAADALTVDPAGLALGELVAGDRAEIAPYWTLGTLYPASAAGIAFTSSASLSQRTELGLFNPASVGLNRIPDRFYYFLNGAWRRVGAAVDESHDHVIVPPDTYVQQRNRAATTRLGRTGRVLTGKIATVISGETSPTDNHVALATPVPVSLNRTRLLSDGILQPGLTERLLVFNPGAGLNLLPDAVYYVKDGAWRKLGASPAQDFGNVTLAPGSGFILRKRAQAPDAVWTFDTGL